jgi:hypothetical protein
MIKLNKVKIVRERPETEVPGQGGESPDVKRRKTEDKK